MTVADFIIILGILVCVSIGVCVKIYRKKHKIPTSSPCKGCPYCAMCQGQKNEEEKPKG